MQQRSAMMAICLKYKENSSTSTLNKEDFFSVGGLFSILRLKQFCLHAPAAVLATSDMLSCTLCIMPGLTVDLHIEKGNSYYERLVLPKTVFLG